MLQCSEEEATLLYRRAAAVRDKYIGNNVYPPGPDRIFEHLRQELSLLRHQARKHK